MLALCTIIFSYMEYFYGRFAVALLVFAIGCKMYAILVNACLGHGITLNTGGSYSVSLDKRGMGTLGSGRNNNLDYHTEYEYIKSAKRAYGKDYLM